MQSRPKVFCVGFNKTGTSSLAKLFEQLDYRVAQQYPAELLARNCDTGDYQPLFDFIETGGEFFQDVPFSMVGTYRPIAEQFPDARFILTIRNSETAWYRSLVEYHGALFGGGKLPSSQDLKNATYGHEGWMFELMKLLFNTPDDDLYNPEILMRAYRQHIEEVTRYFQNQPERLLVVNLSDEEAADQLSVFLNLDEPLQSIPHANANNTALHKLYRRLFSKF